MDAHTHESASSNTRLRKVGTKVSQVCGLRCTFQNTGSTASGTCEVDQNEKRQIALLAHDELLLRWLLTLVWRQRNICECRIGSESGAANLYKARVMSMVNMAMPEWIKERLAVDPQEKFWQVHFREKETKTSHQVRSFLPRQLIRPLEEYS